MDLLGAWGSWKPTGPPYIFDDDRPFLKSGLVCRASWEDAYHSEDFEANPNDRRLHVGVLPHPYFGDLRRVSVYLLQLNPGLGPTDYYGEYEVRAYRDALGANRRQEFTEATYRFLHLDPQFAWHGGFGYWHRKLAAVIEELAKRRAESFAEARRQLAGELACIELLPYHSKKFGRSEGWLRKVPSVELARAFVHDVVLPRVRSDEAIVIVMRRAKVWDLPEIDGVTTYPGGLAQGASLKPNSKGGKAILDHLLRV